MTRTRSGLLPALVAVSAITMSCVHAPQRELPAPGASVPPQIALGQRVRVTPSEPGARPTEGKLLWRSESTLVIAVDSAHARPFELRHLRRIDVWEGRHSYARLGATTFGLAGAVAGVVEGLATRPRCTSSKGSGGSWLIFSFPDLHCVWPVLGSVGWVFLTGTVGGFAGALTGGALGSFVHADAWRSLPLDSLRAGIIPLPGGRLGIGASLAF
jgi:hypothetical protein